MIGSCFYWPTCYMYMLFHRLASFSSILYMNFAIMESIFPAEIIQARLMTASAWSPHQIFSDISGGSSLPSGASHHAPPFPSRRGGHHCRGISFCPDTWNAVPRGHPSRGTLLRAGRFDHQAEQVRKIKDTPLALSTILWKISKPSAFSQSVQSVLILHFTGSGH